MGNAIFAYSSPPTADDRVMRAMQTYKLTRNDIGMFWAVFKKFDRTRQGVIGTMILYNDIFHEPRTLFTNGLFDLIEASDTEMIDFGEFVAIVTTFCFFEIPEMLQYCFFVFDREKNGFIPKEELKLLINALYDNNMNTNVSYALDSIKYKADNKLDFSEFRQMHRTFPSILFPAFRFQNAMMDAVGGERWWSAKKTDLNFAKVAMAKAGEAGERKARRIAEAERDRKIKRHMGALHFYAFFWQRPRYHLIYPVVYDKPSEDSDDDEPDLTAKKKASYPGGQRDNRVAVE